VSEVKGMGERTTSPVDVSLLIVLAWEILCIH